MREYFRLLGRLRNRTRHNNRIGKNMERSGSSPDGDANQEIVTVWTNSPRPRRTKKCSNSASRSSCGRRGPKSVNFKSPPRAVFKSSAAARQACAPDAAIRAHSVFVSAPFPRVAGYRHMPASERQGGGGARGSLECLPEIRADRCRRMRHHAARVVPNPPPCSGPDL